MKNCRLHFPYIRLLFILPVLFINGCTQQGVHPPGLAIDRLSFQAKKNANRGRALTVDFVVAYDRKMAKKLAGMTAQNYFQSIDQLLCDSLGTLFVWRWEIVPGEDILGDFIPVVPVTDPPWAGFIFADYPEGANRVTLIGPSIERLCLIFGPTHIEMSLINERAPALENACEIRPYAMGGGGHLATRASPQSAPSVSPSPIIPLGMLAAGAAAAGASGAANAGGSPGGSGSSVVSSAAAAAGGGRSGSVTI